VFAYLVALIHTFSISTSFRTCNQLLPTGSRFGTFTI